MTDHTLSVWPWLCLCFPGSVCAGIGLYLWEMDTTARFFAPLANRSVFVHRWSPVLAWMESGGTDGVLVARMGSDMVMHRE